TVNGTIDGGGGSDTLDFSAVGSQVVVLTATGATDGFNGTDGLISGGFQNINALVGSTAGTTDSLTGINAPARWTISSPNAGRYPRNTPLASSTVETLTGGTGADSFAFATGGTLGGSIDGGSGTDTITGDNTGRTFTINAANGGTISTILGGTFANVENLT